MISFFFYLLGVGSGFWIRGKWSWLASTKIGSFIYGLFSKSEKA